MPQTDRKRSGMISLRLSPEEERWVRKRAEATGYSVSTVIRRAIAREMGTSGAIGLPSGSSTFNHYGANVTPSGINPSRTWQLVPGDANAMRTSS